MSKLSLIIILVATVGYISAQNCADNASLISNTCYCKMGYYGLNAQVGGTCTPCPTNSYVFFLIAAPPGRFLPQQQTGQVSDCDACIPSSYMTVTASVSPSPSAATCVTCPDNTYNFNFGFAHGTPADCQFCAQNYFMEAASISVDKPQAKCSPCPTGVGTPTPQQYGTSLAQDQQRCNVCLDGYYMTAQAVTGSSPQAAKCSQCPLNSTIPGSNTINTIASCQCYDANANPLSDSAQTCTCKGGYSGKASTHSDGSNGCTACSGGQFASNGSSCATCANGSTLSQDKQSCTCNDSSDGVASWSASTNKCQCSPNYYGDPSHAVSGTTGSCQKCPTGKTSPAGTTSISGCIDPSQSGSSSQGQNGQTETNSTQNISASTTTSSLTISLILILSIFFLN